MHIPEKGYKDEDHLPIRWMPKEVSEEHAKKFGMPFSRQLQKTMLRVSGTKDAMELML